MLQTRMLIDPASKELPDAEERKKIMERAIQTLKNAQSLLERLDLLDQSAAYRAHLQLHFPVQQIQSFPKTE